jgi:hypothetical protein
MACAEESKNARNSQASPSTLHTPLIFVQNQVSPPKMAQARLCVAGEFAVMFEASPTCARVSGTFKRAPAA